MAENSNTSGSSCCAPTSSISDAELTSAVEFETDTRPHISLNVPELRKQLAFYMALFNEKPVKLKEDYAKFELKQPPLNLTLNVHEDNYDKDTEFGIQVADDEILKEMRERLNSEKFWFVDDGDGFYVSDTEGNRWEIYS